MYMKKVCLLLSHEKRLTELEKFIKKLQGCDISCDVRLVKNDDVIRVLEAGKCVETGVLYLSDSAEVVNGLCQEGMPVLAYLHEENQGEDFSGTKYACEEPGELEPEYLERVFRRFKGLPWKILETKRCILRESIEEDTEAFEQIYAEPAVTRYMETLQESRVGERSYIREYITNMYTYYEFGIWTILLKETGQIIGRAGFSVREGCELPELGYVIGVPWQGKGLAKEVCLEILQYAWDEFGFDKMQALIQAENEASIRVAKCLGFEKKGEFTENNKVMYIFVRSNQ